MGGPRCCKWDSYLAILEASKLLSELPKVDVIVTMGCNVNCPMVPCSFREDWGLEDPTGKGDAAFLNTMRLIEEKVLDLSRRLKENMKYL